jgi:hypothetical protein
MPTRLDARLRTFLHIIGLLPSQLREDHCFHEYRDFIKSPYPDSRFNVKCNSTVSQSRFVRHLRTNLRSFNQLLV